MNSYRANVSREGKWWMVSIPELGELTQARRLSEVELMARELIAVNLDVPLSTVQVDVALADVGQVALEQRVGHLREQRATAVTAELAIQAEAGRLAKELAAEGVPMRDIGTLLDVSFQRAHQLASSG
ncbi:MAG: HicB family toxin-antitoxin system [Actinomycetota bacterium]|nr:HicB family toxin-antitoxin system [Actinomycetota bacterium]MDQ2957186.1 HicB family toxin-antitoxin system [Actinomycetota bacterium]